jgi:hypothetical protein
VDEKFVLSFVSDYGNTFDVSLALLLPSLWSLGKTDGEINKANPVMETNTLYHARFAVFSQHKDTAFPTLTSPSVFRFGFREELWKFKTKTT